MAEAIPMKFKSDDEEEEDMVESIPLRFKSDDENVAKATSAKTRVSTYKEGMADIIPVIFDVDMLNDIPAPLKIDEDMIDISVFEESKIIDEDEDKKPIEKNNFVVVKGAKFKSHEFALSRASFILKDWIKGTLKLPIPTEILKSVFLDEREGEEMVSKVGFNIKSQKKFLNEVLDWMIEDHRSLYTSNRLSKVDIKNICFRKLASCFNKSNLDIQTKITEDNMPNKKMLARLLNCSETLAECFRHIEIEGLRCAILYNKTRKIRQYCDCCIEMYIREDLRKHKHKEFPKKFVNHYNSTGLLI